MLDYKRNRLDYGQLLTPPVGYWLAKAIAATYSLDLNTLLSIPVALFYAQTLEGTEEGERREGERIELLEAIQRCPQVLRIYHQEGRIQIPHSQNRLYGLLEDCVVGILPQNAYSSFHPKVWILRYEAKDAPTLYRLIVLSRNLTYDRSWDIAANLDGYITPDLVARNKPLVEFAQHLLSQGAFAGDQQFLSDLERVEFSPPRGFDKNLRFHPLGIKGYKNPLLDVRGEELICVSPFVQDQAIMKLRPTVSGPTWLFSRREELQQLKAETLAGDTIKTYCLSDLIVDGEALNLAEDGATKCLEQNLHAKLFIYKEAGRRHKWFLGSANATTAAFERNVEFLLEMGGSGEAIQLEVVLKQLLGADHKLNVFEPFVLQADGKPDPQKAIDQQVRRLEFELLRAFDIDTVQAELVPSANQKNFDLLLTLPAKPLSDTSSSTAWTDFEIRVAPFNSAHQACVLESQGPQEFRFENINESNLSQFIRFEVFYKGKAERSFLKKIVIRGMPQSRVNQIIRSIINDQDKFFEYLHFLLADHFDKESLSSEKTQGPKLPSDEGASTLWDTRTPILEQLLLAASRRPTRLKEIDNIINQLLDNQPDAQPNVQGDKQTKMQAGKESAPEDELSHDTPGSKAVVSKATIPKAIVPPEFLSVWEAFRTLLPQEIQTAGANVVEKPANENTIG